MSSNKVKYLLLFANIINKQKQQHLQTSDCLSLVFQGQKDGNCIIHSQNEPLFQLSVSSRFLNEMTSFKKFMVTQVTKTETDKEICFSWCSIIIFSVFSCAEIQSQKVESPQAKCLKFLVLIKEYRNSQDISCGNAFSKNQTEFDLHRKHMIFFSAISTVVEKDGM